MHGLLCLWRTPVSIGLLWTNFHLQRRCVKRVKISAVVSRRWLRAPVLCPISTMSAWCPWTTCSRSLCSSCSWSSTGSSTRSATAWARHAPALALCTAPSVQPCCLPPVLQVSSFSRSCLGKELRTWPEPCGSPSASAVAVREARDLLGLRQECTEVAALRASMRPQVTIRGCVLPQLGIVDFSGVRHSRWHEQREPSPGSGRA